MLQPNAGIFRHAGSIMPFERLMTLAEESSVLDEYRMGREHSPASMAAARKGDFKAYLATKGMEGLTDKLYRRFMELQMKSVARMKQPKDTSPVAAPSKSANAQRMSNKGKPKKGKAKSGRGRGFGYVSLSKALKQLAGGPRSTKARLDRAVGSKLYGWLMDAIQAAKPVRTGKRGKALKKRGPLTAKKAEQIGGKFFGKMSKAYPFSSKSAKAPKSSDERIMNKARFIRGLSLAYQLLASNVGKAEKSAARTWLTSKKKKLRMFEWDVLRDLEYLGEEVYETFMSLVQDCETELEECIVNFDTLEEEDSLVDDLDALCEMFDDVLGEGKQSHEARELELYLDNTERHYRQKMAIFKNLAKKQKKGRYNAKLGIKGLMHVVDEAARSYAAEHGTGRRAATRMFPRSARTEVAMSLRDEFDEMVKMGELGESVETLDEAFRLRSADKRVLKAFSMGQAMSSNKLSTDGMTLDGNWMGGNSIASIDQEGRVTLHTTGGKSAQTIHRALRKLVGDGMVEEFEDEDESLDEMFGRYGKPGEGPNGKKFKLRQQTRGGAIISTIYAWDRGRYETLVFAKGKRMLEIDSGGGGRSEQEAVKVHKKLYAKWKSKSKAEVEAAYNELWGHMNESRDLAPGYLLGEGLTAENIDAVDVALVRHENHRVLTEKTDYHKLGSQLQHWHQGEGTPAYKVGSMLFAGRKPWRKDVCDTIEDLQAMMMSPRYGEHESELRSIISRLRSICLH